MAIDDAGNCHEKHDNTKKAGRHMNFTGEPK
jgi:hypothetical protein